MGWIRKVSLALRQWRVVIGAAIALFIPSLAVPSLAALLVVALSLVASFLGEPSLAMAAPLCRTTPDHQICILSIKRSAKYHWQYRAAVKIDDRRRPIQLYDCRRQVRIPQGHPPIPFAPKGAGALICALLDH